MPRDVLREGATRRGWTGLDARAAIGSGAADHRPTRRELLHTARQDAAGRRVWPRTRWGDALVAVSGDSVRLGDLLRARRAGGLAARAGPPPPSGLALVRR